MEFLLDNEPIGFDERPIIYGRPIEENQATLNTSRSVTPADNGKVLRCVASHIALQRSLDTTRQIEVHCMYSRSLFNNTDQDFRPLKVLKFPTIFKHTHTHIIKYFKSYKNNAAHFALNCVER